MQDAFRHRCDTPDATETCSGHGRIETRRIWVTTTLNDYLDFPYVGQAFAIERQVIEKKTGKTSCEIAYGVTSQATYPDFVHFEHSRPLNPPEYGGSL